MTKLKDQQAARNWQVNMKLAKFETVKMQRDQLEEQVSELTNNSEVQTLQHALRQRAIRCARETVCELLV